MSAAVEVADFIFCWLIYLRRWRRKSHQIGRIKIILAGDSYQREQGVTPGIGSAAPILCGAVVSLMAHTGQSDAIHSPEACAKTVLRRTRPAVWSMEVVCTVAISCWLNVLRTISSPLESGA